MSTIKQAGRNYSPSVFLTVSSLLEKSGVSSFLNQPFAVKKKSNTYETFISCEDGKWIQLAHNFVRWCVWVKTLLNLRILLP
jgi:hypothetical protein